MLRKYFQIMITYQNMKSGDSDNFQHTFIDLVNSCFLIMFVIKLTLKVEVKLI